MEKHELYRQQLLEHFHHPCNKGSLKSPDFSSEQANQSCGDMISIEGIIQDNHIISIKFTGSGCIISQATASMLTQDCKDKEINEIMKLDKEYIQSLIGISLGPTRLRCALLALNALQNGLKEYISKRTDCA